LIQLTGTCEDGNEIFGSIKGEGGGEICHPAERVLALGEGLCSWS